MASAVAGYISTDEAGFRGLKQQQLSRQQLTGIQEHLNTIKLQNFAALFDSGQLQDTHKVSCIQVHRGSRTLHLL